MPWYVLTIKYLYEDRDKKVLTYYYRDKLEKMTELCIQANMLYAYTANIIYALCIVKTPVNIFTSGGAEGAEGVIEALRI